MKVFTILLFVICIYLSFSLRVTVSNEMIDKIDEFLENKVIRSTDEKETSSSNSEGDIADNIKELLNKEPLDNNGISQKGEDYKSSIDQMMSGLPITFDSNQETKNVNQTINSKIELNNNKNNTTSIQNSNVTQEVVEIKKEEKLEDPMEFAMKLIQIKNKEKFLYNKDTKGKEINSENSGSINFNKDSSMISSSKNSDSNIIFDHLFISYNGDKHLPNSAPNWVYDQVSNSFIIPEESN
jgi:hypothetical protein